MSNMLPEKNAVALPLRVYNNVSCDYSCPLGVLVISRPSGCCFGTSTT